MTRFDPQQATRWLARRARHGWSWAELSARSGHPVWRLRHWQRRQAGMPEPVRRRGRAFVAVDVTEPEPTRPSSTTTLEITTPSGYRVSVAPGFDAEHLHRVLQTLTASC